MKKHFYKILSFLVLTTISLEIFSQEFHEIEEVNIIYTTKSFYENSRKITPDSSIIKIYSNSNLSEILKIISPSIIKSYGSSGSLGTISFRGSPSNQTSILWNGFQLNSLTSGDFDLSGVSACFFNDIEIIPGASASIFGSGTFGGIIDLKNNFKSENIYSRISFEAGSYKNLSTNVNFKYSKKKFSINFSSSKSKAENNFVFEDIYKIDKPTEIRTNNAFSSSGIIADFSTKPTQKFNIESGIWVMGKSKEIPELAGSYGTGNKFQTDSTLKFYIRLNKLFYNSKLTFGTAYVFDFMHYTDKINSTDNLYFVDSKISGKRLLTDLSYKKYFKNIIIADFGFYYKYLSSETSSYKKNENELNTYFSSKIKLKKINLLANVNLLFFENTPKVFVYNAGINYDFNKINFRINFSKNFRKPTFNELYWNPGGNVNLLNESGLSSETGLEYKPTKNDNIVISSNIYLSKIKNQIQWLPVLGIWQAINNKEAVLYGNETEIRIRLSNEKIKTYINLSYQFTKSFNNKFYNNETYLIGNQLIYVPLHSAKEYLFINYKNLSISIAGYFTGKRFTTEDNNENYSLDAYFISDFYVGYKIKIKNFNINTNLKINNLFNTYYESVKSYPLPGRMFFIGIELEYFKKPR